MNETSVTPTDRATALFESEPHPVLRCSHCGSVITDADADCPTCESPIDWGASLGTLTRGSRTVPEVQHPLDPESRCRRETSRWDLFPYLEPREQGTLSVMSAKKGRV